MVEDEIKWERKRNKKKKKKMGGPSFTSPSPFYWLSRLSLIKLVGQTWVNSQFFFFKNSCFLKRFLWSIIKIQNKNSPHNFQSNRWASKKSKIPFLVDFQEVQDRVYSWSLLRSRSFLILFSTFKSKHPSGPNLSGYLAKFKIPSGNLPI